MSIKSYAVAVLAVGSFSFANAATVTVKMMNTKGESIGTADITELAKGVKIDLDLKGLPPGEHAFHIHEKGTCTAPKFESAGGHFAPSHHGHGFDSKKGFHAGDMSNIMVAADGSVKEEIINTEVTLGKGASSLKKTGGTAFVIHEKADDYKSQPSGAAGSRLACGEIK